MLVFVLDPTVPGEQCHKFSRGLLAKVARRLAQNLFLPEVWETMADLEDLFGAFDGESKASNAVANEAADEGGQSHIAKKERRSALIDEGPHTDGDDVAVVEQKEERLKRSTAASTVAAASAVAVSVRGDDSSSTRHAHSGLDGAGPSDAASSPGASKVQNAKDEERLVATGTSHDKSIRSYSSIPINVKASQDHEQAKVPNISKLPPAKVYPFQLDPFQEMAISYVEKGESVLVAAHTSAGKTAVAEYAVAKSLRDGQRVIYTSPIKALSNQKYRDLQEEFEDVGLMTGDITLNPSATALVRNYFRIFRG